MSASPALDRTEVGNYFIANYPPFSVWRPEAVDAEARPALASPPVAGTPLGLYLHIPFCRKRCHFCYFRVYTDKNASEVQSYLDTLAREWELYAEQAAIAGRPLNFVYFGGGTPSYISTKQLESLVTRMDAVSTWRQAEEITFECEPGTLTEHKLASIRNIGVTRLSLGVENFDDAILEANGRAHRSGEIGKAYAFAQTLGFPQINIDLIAGMLGETTGATACGRRSTWRPTASPSTRWSCRSTRPSARTCWRRRRAKPWPARVRTAASPTGRPNAGGSKRPSKRSSAPGTTSGRPTPP
jgi:oxygen-independent coproporphyrinogen-3 oxidase